MVIEIPTNKRLDILIEIYRRKDEDAAGNLVYIVREIIEKISSEQITEFLRIVSEELKVTQDQNDIISVLQILPYNLWPNIDEAARLRIENKLVRSIEGGKIKDDGEIISGYLGTWAAPFLKYFSVTKARGVLIEKLQGTNEQILYVFRCFLSIMPELYEGVYKQLMVEPICNVIKNDHSLKIELLKVNWPEDWSDLFVENSPEIFSDDDFIPF